MMKSILSIDWDLRTLRIVHGLVGRRSVEIDQVFNVPIPAEIRLDDADSLGGFVRQVLDKAGIRTKRAVVGGTSSVQFTLPENTPTRGPAV